MEERNKEKATSYNMYEFLTVNTTMNKINNTGVCFTWFVLSLHVSILADHHQVIVSIHLNKILQLLKGLCA
jgi:hypothetical protein